MERTGGREREGGEKRTGGREREKDGGEIDRGKEGRMERQMKSFNKTY